MKTSHPDFNKVVNLYMSGGVEQTIAIMAAINCNGTDFKEARNRFSSPPYPISGSSFVASFSFYDVLQDSEFWWAVEAELDAIKEASQ